LELVLVESGSAVALVLEDLVDSEVKVDLVVKVEMVKDVHCRNIVPLCLEDSGDTLLQLSFSLLQGWLNKKGKKCRQTLCMNYSLLSSNHL